ncbi:MAG: Beta-lactamase superfamily domain, partial [Thermoleophilaceae bacterium]|nr:Beta-lactamase superfamily domain [Thermoleophilaceae bacterium]
MLIEMVEWLGHAGFRVTAGKHRIYIDPYRVGAGAPAADLILVTTRELPHDRAPGDRRDRRDRCSFALALVARR